MQDPVYTTSSGEITDIGDPEWLGQFSAAVTNLQRLQYSQSTAGADQYYAQYARVVCVRSVSTLSINQSNFRGDSGGSQV